MENFFPVNEVGQVALHTTILVVIREFYHFYYLSSSFNCYQSFNYRSGNTAKFFPSIMFLANNLRRKIFNVNIKGQLTARVTYTFH